AQLGTDFKGLTLAITVVDIVFFAIGLLSIDLQAQYAILDRATQHEIALENIARAAVRLQGAIQANGAAPFLGHFAGNDVDHTAHGVGAIQRGHGAAYDLDTLNFGQGRGPA